jgi:hypothetical protein
MRGKKSAVSKMKRQTAHQQESLSPSFPLSLAVHLSVLMKEYYIMTGWKCSNAATLSKGRVQRIDLGLRNNKTLMIN